MNYIAYTDGSCLSNPGFGGYAHIIISENGNKIKTSGYREDTTNNRMELYAILNAIETIENLSTPAVKYKSTITIYTDSSYCVNTINLGWLYNWKKNGWKNKANQEVKNKDLWKRMDNILENTLYKIELVKVKGHSGNRYNEIVDKMAKDAACKGKLKYGS